IILKGIKNMSYSKINVIYNHYNSINSFTFTRKTLFPISFEESSGKSHKEDFIVETDINDLFVNLITLYISYQIIIAEANSWAAENVMRQQITRESLKKIDEIEFYKSRKERKEKKYKDFKKIIENYQRKGI
ncbi:MAG: F0F1 ATP synthase subunit gamma, partial [Bacilli bacterium]|nr:F0F1 ATP synthase subunit gamma [Bacilli bacterium]